MPKVGLTFSHLLSKVKFSFTNGFASPNYTISVKNIKMIVPAKAEIALVGDWWSTNKWEQYNGTTTLEFGDMESEKIQVTKGAESQKERLTIPAPATQEYTVTFDVELYQGAVLAYSNSLSTTISGAELKIGNAYNFHATLDHTNIAGDELDPIEFDVTEVKEWVDGNGYEGNVIDTKVVGVKNAAALAAAAEAGATNFRLISDVNGTLTFSNTMRSAANYTLDLNGKTIDVAGDAIVVDNGVKLTINGNGTVKAGQNASGNALWVKHGDVTINGGSWYVGGDPNSTTGSKRNDCIYVGSAANKDNAGQFVSSVTINAGTFEAAVEELGQYWVLNIQDQFAAARSKITVYGGSYKNFDPAKNVSEGENTSFVADGYESVADGEYFNVVPALKQHSVATADQLFAAVNAGGNITLTADITVSSPVVVEAGKVVNINLGGFTLKNKKENAATDVIIVKGNLSIDNGTVEAVTGNDGYAIISEGVLTINGGTYKSGVDANNKPNAVIYARGNGEVYVNGGLFPNDYQSTFVLNKKDADRATTTISCTGGHFYHFNPADNAAENPGTNFCANGYKAQMQDDGSWEVVPN